MRNAVLYNFLIEANLIAGIAILLLIPIRKFLRGRLGSRALCFAWLLVALRLLLPLSLPNPLINEIVTPYNQQPDAIRPIAAQVQIRVHDALNDATFTNLEAKLDQGMTYPEAAKEADYRLLRRVSSGMVNGRGARLMMGIYLLGVLAVAGWFVIANVRFQRKLKKNRMGTLEGEMQAYYPALCEKHQARPLPVYLTDPLSSACLVGVIHPFIALPLAADPRQAKQMLAHEICHYKAKDHLWTLLALICCAVHWFNPLVWAAAAMSRMDRELRCDDNVTKDMDEDGRREYAGTLIQAVTRRPVPGLPMLATGMSMTGRKLKIRVSGILRSGKYGKALSAAFAATASLLLVMAFGTAAYGETPSFWENGGKERAYEVMDVSEALKSENAVATQEQAIQIAQRVLASDDFKIDVTDKSLEWQMYGISVGPWGKPCYDVVAKRSGEDGRYTVSVSVDGSGCWNVTNGFDPFYLEDLVGTYDTQESDAWLLSVNRQNEIIQYCLDVAEHLEPGETQYFQDIHIIGYVKTPDALYVEVDAEYNESSGKTFIVLVEPELRMVDYYTGNG